MKASVAITLIIVGGLLVATPVISDYFARQQLVELLSKNGATTASLGQPLGDHYRLGCWSTGSLIVLAAIFFSRNAGSGEPSPKS